MRVSTKIKKASQNIPSIVLEDLTTLKLDQSNGWGKLRSVDRKGMFAVDMMKYYPVIWEKDNKPI